MIDLTPLPRPDWLDDALWRAALGRHATAIWTIRPLGGVISRRYKHPFDLGRGADGITARLRALRALDDLTSRGVGMIGRAALSRLADGKPAAQTWSLWRAAVQAEARVAITHSLIVGANTLQRGRLYDGFGALDDQFELARRKTASLAARAAAGEITPRQAVAWSRQAVRGHAHAAGIIGTMQGIEGPVRWVMRPGEFHCTTCPSVAQTYPSIATLLDRVGGFPGSGVTECHGNCKCSLEPAERASVFEDTGRLVTPAGAEDLTGPVDLAQRAQDLGGAYQRAREARLRRQRQRESAN